MGTWLWWNCCVRDWANSGVSKSQKNLTLSFIVCFKTFFFFFFEKLVFLCWDNTQEETFVFGLSSIFSERRQSSIRAHSSSTYHCFKGGCLLLSRAAHVLGGGACQQQPQLSGGSKMADLWTAVVSRETCPLTDASAARTPSLPSPPF